MNEKKLKARDFITIGIFTAILWVVQMVIISACMSCGFDRILREGAFFKPVNSNFP